MSTNDDSASRRSRRPDAGSQQWRPQNGQDREDRRYQSSTNDRDAGNDTYFDPRNREHEAPQSDPRRSAYSGFSRHSYPPQRQDPPPPPAPTPPPQQREARYYPEQAPRFNGGQAYNERSYEQEAPTLPHPDLDRDDLFGQDSAPSLYGHRNDIYEQPSYRQPAMQGGALREAPRPDMQRDAASPLDDYERSFAARIAAQESQASRFFLPEDVAPQRPAQPVPDTGYMAQNHYSAGTFEPQAASPASYRQNSYESPGTWGDEPQDVSAGDIHGGLPQTISHGDELDEDFFADEEDLYHEGEPGHAKKGRKKLIAAALIGAIGVGGGGMYAYKHVRLGGGANGGTPIIRADGTAKEVPANPGGKQFANGDKLIYERLTPDGHTQVASVDAGEVARTPARNTTPATPAAGNSLEDRIEEALKKAQRSGDVPASGSPSSSNSGPAGRPDQPTVVRGETYRPDGTKVDGGRPMVTPSIANAGQLPPPFGNAAPTSRSPFTSQVQAAPIPPAAFRTAAVQQVAAPRSAQPASQAAEPVQSRLALATPASGYYVQIKSSQDEKAATRELNALNEKYSVVLGSAQLVTKTVDLGDKGVWFRTMAGPLNTKEAAGELCTKLKGAGLSSCLIQKSE